MINKKNLKQSNFLPEITGTGIIPYTFHNNRILFLLGREARYTDWEDGHKWAEFGGHRDKNESIWDATIREGYEEMMGLYTREFINQKIKVNHILTTYDSYAFLIKVPYNNICNHFKLFYQYMVTQYPNSFFVKSVKEKGTFEKDDINWFSYDEIDELSKKGILRRAMTDFLPQLKQFSNHYKK